MFFILSTFLFFELNVNPIIVKLSEAKVRVLTNKAVNTALSKILSENLNYSDIINITSDKEGKILAMQANSGVINAISTKTVLEAQKNIELIGEQGVDIPFGSLSGIPIFSGKGPSIHIRVYPVGSIKCEFRSELKSAGINQTRHRIFLLVNSNVTVVLPGSNQAIKATNEVILSEDLIIGEVPEVYLNSNNIDEMLNLVP